MTSLLSDDERALLSVRADEFHAALARGAGSDWEPFLKGIPDQVRLAVLTELVIIDLIYRWEHKERPEIEEYLSRFPEFGPADRVPNNVIIEEYRCRRKAGEHYDVSRYQSRFPVQFPLVQAELEAAAGSDQGQGTYEGSMTGTLVGAASVPSPHPARAHMMSGAVSEEYDFVRVLGQGVFGEVWLARKKTSGIEKAIKVVTQPADKDAAKRERRSLELIKNLRHPYLLSTEDFWVKDNRLHIVMELAECTLRNRMEKCQEKGLPGIPGGELLSYIREAAEGLDFLHAKHVVHRDVKPDNILILNGHSKVADFGLAWHQEKVLAPMKTFAGTPAYMAPEIWGKEGGPASDQYSLAVAYAELRQGHPPLQGQQLQEMMFAHFDGTHDFDPIVSEEERRVLVKALARQPEQRYPSCMAFAEALSLALGISFVPRSGAMAEAPSGVKPQPASNAPKTVPSSRSPSPQTLGSIAPGSHAQRTVETHAASNTVADSTEGPVAGSAVAQKKPARSGLKTVLASLITLGLLGALSVAVWAMLQKSDEGQAKTTASGDPTKADEATTPPKATTAGGVSNFVPPDLPSTQPVKAPNSNPPFKPPGANVASDQMLEVLANGKKAYKMFMIPIGREGVRFHLIASGQGPRPVPPFYIMESKVWNELFRAGNMTPPAASERFGPDAPVTSITFAEANAFARQVLGGKLPSADEWDLAAGLYSVTNREEVTLPSGRPRIKLKQPAPAVGTDAGSDTNSFELRDMAGNGREWTRTLLLADNSPAEIGSAPLTEKSLIILRGRNYTLSRGLTFDILRYEQTNPQTQFADARSPYTSFRVIIPLP